MSAPFTTTLRARPGSLRIGVPGEATLTFRVQVPELWETLRVEAPADTPVAAVKEQALRALIPDLEYPEDYMTRIGGWEVLDETASIAAAGARDGSIFLVSGRRRRPVR